MTPYYRPLAMSDPHRPAGALTLAGGWCWFDRVERIEGVSAVNVFGAVKLVMEMKAKQSALQAAAVAEAAQPDPKGKRKG